MTKVVLTYRFQFPDSRERVFPLEMDKDTAELSPARAESPPPWTQLGFNQCSNCPLKASEVTHCPAALHLSAVIDGFTDLVSYDKVRVTVEVPAPLEPVMAMMGCRSDMACLRR